MFQNNEAIVMAVVPLLDLAKPQVVIFLAQVAETVEPQVIMPL